MVHPLEMFVSEESVINGNHGEKNNFLFFSVGWVRILRRTKTTDTLIYQSEAWSEYTKDFSFALGLFMLLIQ